MKKSTVSKHKGEKRGIFKYTKRKHNQSCGKASPWGRSSVKSGSKGRHPNAAGKNKGKARRDEQTWRLQAGDQQ